MNSARPAPRRRTAWLGVLALALLVSEGAAQSPLSSHAVQQLLRETASGGVGKEVSLEGVVLFHEPSERILVVGDDAGSVLVETTGAELGLAPGQSVAVRGITGRSLGNPAVVRGAVSSRAGRRELAPKTVDIAAVVRGLCNYQFVEVEGLVATVAASRGRTMLHLHAGPSHMDVPIRDLPFAERAVAQFKGARVRLRGVALPYQLGPNRVQQGIVVVVNAQEEVQILTPGAPPDYDVPATPLDHVPVITTECQIRVTGAVERNLGNRWLQLHDDSGRMRVRLDQSFAVKEGDYIEALGFPTATKGEAVMDHCSARVLAPRLARPNEPVAGPAPRVPLLRSMAEVLELKPEPVHEGLPARFQAMVTCPVPSLNMVFLRGPKQAIRAILASGTNLPAHLAAGQIVEVKGYTHVGGFLPHLVEASLTPVAEGTLPLPRELTYDALASGQHENEWVGIRGIVRAVRPVEGTVVVELASSGGRFPVLLPAKPGQSLPRHLVDAEVRVRGVCNVIPNQRLQARGFRIHASDIADLQVERPAPADPFQPGVQRIADLFRYQANPAPGHRAKIRGVVTLVESSHAFYLRGSNASIRVELAEAGNAQPGDHVDVVGFPVLKDNQPKLEDAILQVTAHGPAPAPKALRPAVVTEDAPNADEWAVLEGRLLEVRTGSGQPTLVLEADQNLFETRFLRKVPADALRDLEPGSLLRVQGICQFLHDEHAHPRAFSLLAASMADVTVLRRGPALTPNQVAAVLASLAALFLAALAWVTLLRRQVRKQTRVILDLNANLERRVADRTAELQAANRELESFSYSVSHDLRGPLRAVNGFAEILLQTHGAQLDERGSRYLRQVAEGGRRMGRLVDDLLTFSRLGRQPVSRAPVDLHLLARRAVEDLQRQHPQRQVQVVLPPLPPAQGDRPLLEQVLINLLGNAWKFTARQPAARVEVGTTTQGGQPVYFVRDNGAGFDMKYADKLFGVFQRLHAEEEFPGTGVGLAIVQRILHRHGGHIWAQASPGEGATFFFTLPQGPHPDAPAAEPAQAFGK